jgi:hypothetical protein
VAGITLLGFVWVAYPFGLGSHLVAFALPFGLVSIAISKLRPRVFEMERRRLVTLRPFTFIAQVLAVRRSLPGFRKKRYPEALAGKHIRSAIMNRLMLVPCTMVWLMFSPLVLCFQALPNRDEQLTIIPA